MEGLSEAEKQVAAITLIVGLLFVFVKVIYESVMHERFTFFNLFHPVKPISSKERNFIASFLVPFQTFNSEQRRRFLKRFAWFKSKKAFVFYGEIENKEEIKAYVSASAILVTMGLKNYKFQNTIARIIVYPSQYFSNISKQHHLGEYNPRLKTLVFSADDLKQGFKIPNDNINLGIHEVAHALLFENNSRANWQSKKFSVGVKKLRTLFDEEGFKERINTSTHIRDYAKTNFVEFFAVLLESFFENPEGLKQEFPKIHFYLSKMLNV